MFGGLIIRDWIYGAGEGVWMNFGPKVDPAG